MEGTSTLPTKLFLTKLPGALGRR